MGLIKLVVDIVGNLNPLKRDMDRAVSESVRGGEAIGAGISSGLKNALTTRLVGGGLAYSVAQASGEAVTAAVGIAGAKGALALGRIAIDTSGSYHRLQLGFESILGDANKAKTLMDVLKAQGANTPFRTEDLSRYAQQLLFTGVNARRLVGDMQALEDVTAARGGTTEDMGQIVDVLRGMRTRPRLNQEELHPLTALMDIQKVYTAGTGRKSRNAADAALQLSGMTGEQAYDTLIRGIQKVYGGSAAKLQNALLSSQIQQAQENVGLALEPTGDRLTAAIRPIVSNLGDAANAFGTLNKSSKGLAGVILIGAGLVAGLASVVPAGMSAILSLRTLSGAVRELAVSAAGATPATAAAARAQMARNLNMASGAVLPNAIKPLPGAVTASSPFAAIGLAGMSVAGFAAGLVGISAASSYIAERQAKSSGATRDRWAFGSSMLGTMITTTFGMIPGLNILTGGAYAYGTHQGGKAGAEQAAKDKADKQKEALDKNTEMLGQNTKALQDMAFQVLGGGGRTKNAISLLEREYAGSLLRGGIA